MIFAMAVSATSTLGNLGSTAAFTSNGLSLPAAAFSTLGVATNLFAKNEGPEENGLGIAGGLDSEVNGTAFIQLDLKQILAQNPSALSIMIGSLQSGESFDIWGSNTAGTPSTLLLSNQTKSTVSVPDLGQFRYVFISAATGTVLLSGWM